MQLEILPAKSLLAHHLGLPDHGVGSPSLTRWRLTVTRPVGDGATRKAAPPQPILARPPYRPRLRTVTCSPACATTTHHAGTCCQDSQVPGCKTSTRMYGVVLRRTCRTPLFPSSDEHRPNLSFHCARVRRWHGNISEITTHAACSGVDM